jgi:pseudouridine synthase
LVKLNKPLSKEATEDIERGRVVLDDKPSVFNINYNEEYKAYEITLYEGRNRQIRRTFEKLGYQVIGLKRISFGDYTIEQLEGALYKVLD